MHAIQFNFGSSVTDADADSSNHLLVGTVTNLSGPTATVREFCCAVETALRESHNINANAVAAFLPSSIDRALPPHEALAKFVGKFDEATAAVVTVAVLGDYVPITLSSADLARGDDDGIRKKKKMQHTAEQINSKDTRIPVTILTGFLGSGKTTMLNHILHEQRHRKIAVIENEFGEVPIDNEILGQNKHAAAEQVVVLGNGCMCCQVRGDILGAFAQIGETVAQGNHLDSVVVETTGLADPLPIVRTFLQTPAISTKFRLDGVITMVDAKHLLGRLNESPGGDHIPENSVPGYAQNGKVNEAFQQIMYANKIVLNKLDLVSVDVVCEVWARVRSINSTARIQAAVRGQLDPDDLTGLLAFDMEAIDMDAEIQAEEDLHQHNDCADDCHSHSHGHSHRHSHNDADEHAHGGGKHGDHHENGMKSFSLIDIDPGMEVVPLEFARWLRVLSTPSINTSSPANSADTGAANTGTGDANDIPETSGSVYADINGSSEERKQGKLYRSKGVFAVRGHRRKLLFQAVGDVMEKQYVSKWEVNEQRGSKIVFIGQDLDRDAIEAGYRACLRPVSAVLEDTRSNHALEMLKAEIIQHVLSFLNTKDVGILGFVSKPLLRLIFRDGAGLMHDGVDGLPFMQAGGHNAGWQSYNKLNDLYLHTLLPMSSIESYTRAFRIAHPEIGSLQGLPLSTVADAEALGVTMLEAAELMKDYKDTKLFLLDFKWRRETLDTFFAGPVVDQHKNMEEENGQGNNEKKGEEEVKSKLLSTNSSLLKVEYEVQDENSFDDETDILKFRVQLQPAISANSSGDTNGQDVANEDDTPPGLEGHRLAIQVVGGKSCSQVYQLSFHTVSPLYQLHVPIPDHRNPLTTCPELLHKWHPMMEDLKANCRLRFLVRLKPDGSGPLGDMCGCC